MTKINTNLEIFCGTGGVGKTTLAAARALYLSSIGKKTLIITIDPSLRLKQLLSIKDEECGEIVPVRITKEQINSFDAELLSPKKTFQKLFNKNISEVSNPIIESLTKQYGGINEIMGLLELSLIFEKNCYDTIILDTPPGTHFLDFIKIGERLKNFLDNTLLDVLFSMKSDPKSKTSFFSSLIENSTQKVFGFLEKITGASFIQSFTSLLSEILVHKKKLDSALEITNLIYNPERTHFYLVIALDQVKSNETENLIRKKSELMKLKSTLLLNRSKKGVMKGWKPKKRELQLLKKQFISQEEETLDRYQKIFDKILIFDDIQTDTLRAQISELSLKF